MEGGIEQLFQDALAAAKARSSEIAKTYGGS